MFTYWYFTLIQALIIHILLVFRGLYVVSGLQLAWPSILHRGALPRPRSRDLAVTWSGESQLFICDSGSRRAPVSGGDERTEGGGDANKTQISNSCENRRQKSSRHVRGEAKGERWRRRFAGMVQWSRRQTCAQMCGIKWPGLHVSVNRRSVCVANEWAAAHQDLTSRRASSPQRGPRGFGPR